MTNIVLISIDSNFQLYNSRNQRRVTLRRKRCSYIVYRWKTIVSSATEDEHSAKIYSGVESGLSSFDRSNNSSPCFGFLASIYAATSARHEPLGLTHGALGLADLRGVRGL